MPQLIDRRGNVIGDLNLQAPMRSMAGVQEFHKFGRNSDVGTAAAEDITDIGAVWVPPTDARIHAIVSTEAADDDVGTGAQEVEVIGLDANYLAQSETVVLDGLTPVNTVNTYRNIHRMYVTRGGSGGKNAGNITATAATDSTVTAQITAGFNQTLMAAYMVPADKDLYLFDYYATCNKANTTGAFNMAVLVKPFGGVYQTKHYQGANAAGRGRVDHNFTPYLKVSAKSIIKMQGDVTANGFDISAGFDGLLVDTIITNKL